MTSHLFRHGVVSLAFLFLTLAVVAAHAQTAALEEAERLENINESTRAGSSASSRTFLSSQFRKMSAGLFNFSSVPMNQAHEAAAQLSAYNYLTLDYRISQSQKFAVRPVFQFDLAGTNNRDQYKPGDFRIGDAYVDYVDYTLALLPYDFELSGQFRFYAPTSSESQDRGMIMRLRPWFLASRRMSRNWTLAVHFEPDYYVQSRTSYMDERGRVYGNRNIGYESKIELERRITPVFAAAGSIGHTQMWSHSSIANHVEGRDTNDEAFRQEALKLDLSVNMSLRGLFMVAGVSQMHDLVRPRDSLQFLNDTESEYYLLSALRF